MKAIYTKTVLYAYTRIEAVKRQIDDYVERKALASMNDHSPCDEQCERIIKHMAQKVILTQLKSKLNVVLACITDEEMDLLDFKYFRKRSKSYYEHMNTTGRSYYRKQSNLLKKISRLCGKSFLTDQWFEENCLKINFIRRIIKMVERSERTPTRFREEKMLKEIDQKKQKNDKKQSKGFKLSA